MEIIYLDNNATTRTDPSVVEAMLPWFSERYGNASSAHVLGHLSEAAVAQAREQVAELLNTSPEELVFNSGGTEGLVHVLRGVFEGSASKRHVVISSVEHSAVHAAAAALKASGVEVTVIGVDGDGQLDLDALEASLRPDTALVAVMAANNETGVLFPMDEIAARVKAKSVLLLVDAVQAVGKVPLDLAKLPADFLTLSGHKFHGPKGVGALFIRRGRRLKALFPGHQERDRRAGTSHVPGIVGLGQAASLAARRLPEMERVAKLRDRLEAGLLSLPGVRIHGGASPRLPNTCFAGFEGMDGEALLLALGAKGICVSTGSACATGQVEPSHVLQAMGVPKAIATSSIRFSLSPETTSEEIQTVVGLLPGLIEGLGR